jgi:hypothetical protein
MIIFLVIALATGTAHANGLPFFPNTNVPDYTAKLVVHDTLDGKDNWRVVQHHNGWTHVEETQGDETHIWYGHFFQNIVLSTRKKMERRSSASVSGKSSHRMTTSASSRSRKRTMWRQWAARSAAGGK